MTRYCQALALAAFLRISAPAWPEPGAPLPLKTITDIPLAGHTTRFDYQAYDPTCHLLFIAHLGDSAVTVVDTRSQDGDTYSRTKAGPRRGRDPRTGAGLSERHRRS